MHVVENIFYKVNVICTYVDYTLSSNRYFKQITLTHFRRSVWPNNNINILKYQQSWELDDRRMNKSICLRAHEIIWKNMGYNALYPLMDNITISLHSVEVLRVFCQKPVHLSCFQHMIWTQLFRMYERVR